jgi:hypothetical protein
MKLLIAIFIITFCVPAANTLKTEQVPILTLFIDDGSIPPPSKDFRNDNLNPVLIMYENGNVVWRKNTEYFQKRLHSDTIRLLINLFKIELLTVDSSINLEPLAADVPTLLILNKIGNNQWISIRGVKFDEYDWFGNSSLADNSLPTAIVTLLKVFDNVCRSDFNKFEPAYIIATAHYTDQKKEHCTNEDFPSFNYIKLPRIGYDPAYLIPYCNLNKLCSNILQCNNFRIDNGIYSIWYRFMMPGGDYEKKLLEIQDSKQ